MGVAQTATFRWRKAAPKGQLFYGHSHTAPTPKEYILQKLGLVISNSLAIHLRDAKLGQIVEPTDPYDEDYVEQDADLHRATPSPGHTPPDFEDGAALFRGQLSATTTGAGTTAGTRDITPFLTNTFLDPTALGIA